MKEKSDREAVFAGFKIRNLNLWKEAVARCGSLFVYRKLFFRFEKNMKKMKIRCNFWRKTALY